MSTNTFQPLNINADRICEGLSKIGYTPWSAIMDIVDNAVAAGAKDITVEFLIKDGFTINNRDNIYALRIIDDGQGMTDEQVNTALDIGSHVSYSKESISKFGIGLKSAGFSLGNCISVVSKKDSCLTPLKYVDRDEIRQRDAYGVVSIEPCELLANYLDDYKSGTIIEVSKPVEPQDSASKIITHLRNRLGVVYYHFIADDSTPIKIHLKYPGRDGYKKDPVSPIDIMFVRDSYEEFDADSYDAKYPVLVEDTEIEHPQNPSLDPIRLQICIFPMAKMAEYPGFTEEERKRIQKYMIKRENSGFFFFRNNRLIRWGDINIANIKRDDIIFRAKVSITSDHDELFYIDVSKQNLTVPEGIEKKLETHTRVPKGIMGQVQQICNDLYKTSDNKEGAEYERRNEGFEEIDPELPTHERDPEEVKRRQEKLEARTQIKDQEYEQDDAQDQEHKEVDEESATADEEGFHFVRYTDRMRSLDLWEAGYDKINGTYVRINRNHPYYNLVLVNLPPADPTRQAIEALLHMNAIAQNMTITGMDEIDVEYLYRIFNKFRTLVSYNLQEWASDNQDLYE